MSRQRIQVMLRHTWFHARHSVETWVDLILNPLVQLVIFVYIVTFLSGGNSQEAGYVIAGAVLWNVVWIGQYSITIGALWEVWSRSFSSLFISPLTLSEFIVAQMLSGLVKAFFVLILSDLVARLLYGFTLLSIGWLLPIFILELLLFSWAVGMFVLGLIIRFGTTIQSFSWLLVFLVQPIGAVFYPVSILPPIIQKISFLFPVTYIFELVRGQLAGQPLQVDYLLLGTILNAIYLIASYLFVQAGFVNSKKTGSLVRIEG